MMSGSIRGAMRMTVVVSTIYLRIEIAIPVAKSDLHASMVACAAAYGHSLRLHIIFPQNLLEPERYESDFPPESCCAVYQENKFVAPQLFNDWLEHSGS
jgi:hypothetical protein